jgi:hypothetical protein
MEENKKTAKTKPVNNTEQKPEVINVGEFKTTIAENVNNEPKMVEEEKTVPAKKWWNRFINLKSKPVTNDAKQTKHFAWLAYILFFIPLLINSKSAFVRHNANEGLEINIFDAIAAVLLILGAVLTKQIAWVYLLTIIFTVIGIVLLVLTTVTKVYMIAVTLQGREVSTPWMWN